MSNAMAIEIVISIACAIISGVILYVFKKTDKKTMEGIKKRVIADIAQRELILAMSDALEVVLKKLHGEKLNGDVQEAKDELTEKRDELLKITRNEYFSMINKKG